jgi:hypothetical protein
VSFLPELDGIIQEGRGISSELLGQTYDVRRLTGVTNVSVSANAPVIPNFLARIKRAKKVAVENTFFELMVYEATCDNSLLRVQDLLTETGYESDGGSFIFAQARPTRETIWVRVESNVSLSRPTPAGGSAAQQPATGAVWNAGYSGVWKAGDRVLTLNNGFYSFSSAPGSIPATIACGLQPNTRIRDGNTLAVPTEQERVQYACYVPNLPGEQLNELDRLSFPNSDRYEIAKLFTTDYTGLSGYICIVEKLGS